MSAEERREGTEPGDGAKLGEIRRHLLTEPSVVLRRLLALDLLELNLPTSLGSSRATLFLKEDQLLVVPLKVYLGDELVELR
jgi:hypothetical protein